jgi:hypothetical protein
MKYLLVFLITLIVSVPVLEAQATSQQAPADIDVTVRYLIEVVEKSDYTFVRNSTRYGGAEAAQHLQRKYRHFRDKIRTVDDFIELAASHSLLTGEPYLVIDSAGRSTPTGQWLRQVLSDYCARQSTDTVSRSPDNAAVQCAE